MWFVLYCWFSSTPVELVAQKKEKRRDELHHKTRNYNHKTARVYKKKKNEVSS